MREADVRELLESAAAGDAPPSAVDLDRAVRDGHRTRTTRRALLAGGAALGVSGVLGATAILRSGKPDPIVAGWEWPPPVYGAFGGPTLNAAPDRFDLFGQWAVFGWLPFRPPDFFSYVEPDVFGLEARGDQVVHLALLRREQAAEELARKGAVEPAPPVAGSTARWISSDDGDQDFLQWRCAPGMWAQVTTWAAKGGPGKPTGPERRTMLHRVASATGLSATRRRRFPFRTAAVPAGIPLHRLELTLAAKGHWEVGIRGGSLESLTISLTNVPPPSRTVHTGRFGLPKPDTTDTTTTRSDVDGLPGAYVRDESSELVIAFRPDDITVSVAASREVLRQLGPDGALGLYRTIEVLPHPATWSDRPI
jgi:hypothetical protein